MYLILFTFVNIVCRIIADRPLVHTSDLNKISDDNHTESIEEVEKIYKFLVVIELHGDHVCSGTIVHPTLILTVGSCLIQSNVPTDYTIRPGIYLPGHNDNVFKVSGLIYNPNFVWMGYLRTKLYDAAILVLSKPLKFTDKIGKIVLPREREDVPPNTKAILISWNGDHLRVQKVMVLSNMDCYLKNNRFGNNLQRYPIDSQVCVDSFAKCDKHVGIPLIVGEKIYGIYSDHYQGCESGSPPMFTRVSSIRSWIVKIISRFDST